MTCPWEPPDDLERVTAWVKPAPPVFDAACAAFEDAHGVRPERVADREVTMTDGSLWSERAFR